MVSMVVKPTGLSTIVLCHLIHMVSNPRIVDLRS